MTMAMCRKGRILIGVHDAHPPTDAEWRNWLELCTKELGQLRSLVETHGGGPDAKQRKAMSDALAGRDLRSAILSDSFFVRGIVTAISWLGIKLRAFPLDEHAAAGEYLGLRSEELALALAELTRLRKQCGLGENRVA